MVNDGGADPPSRSPRVPPERLLIPPDRPAPPAPAAGALADLAAAASAGDEGAFGRLHERLGAGLRRFLAKRSGGTAEEVEELAQKTWAAAWVALTRGRYDPARAAFTTFLYAVGFRTWLQERRTRRRRAAWWASGPRGSTEGFEGSLFDDAPDQAGFLQTCELLDAVRACLRATEGADALTDEEVRILRAAAAGEPDRAVGARLGIAASTVHARRRGAYAKLRRMLAARGFAGPSAERGGAGGG